MSFLGQRFLPLILLLIIFCNLGSSSPAHADCLKIKKSLEDISFKGDLSYFVLYLSSLYDFRITLEEDYRYCGMRTFGYSRCLNEPHISIKGDDMNLFEVLNKTMDKLSSKYSWTEWNCEVVNIYPTVLDNNPDFLFNVELQNINITDSFYNIFKSLMTALRSKFINAEIGRPKLVGTKCLHPNGCNKLERSRNQIDTDLKQISTLRIRKESLRNLLNRLVTRIGIGWTWRSEITKISNMTDSDNCGYMMSIRSEVKILNYQHDQSKQSLGRHYSTHLDKKVLSKTKEECDVKEWIKLNSVRKISIHNSRIEDVIIELARSYEVPIYLEKSMMRCKGSDQTCLNDTKFSIVGKMSLKNALNSITTEDRRYVWNQWKSRAINFYPRFEESNVYYIMNQPPKYKISGDTVKEILEEIRSYLRSRNMILEIKYPNDSKDAIWNEKINTLKRNEIHSCNSIREYLNALFSGTGFVWKYQTYTLLVDMKSDWWCGIEARSELVPLSIK